MDKIEIKVENSVSRVEGKNESDEGSHFKCDKQHIFSLKTLSFITFTSLCFLLVLPFIGFPQLNTPYYIIPIAIGGGLNAFYVLPILTDYLHKKETHVTHLIDKKFRKRPNSIPKNAVYYIKAYRYSLIFTSSILLGVIVYYVLFDLEGSKLNRVEIMGILFGYISFYRKIQQWLSHIILFLLVNCKNKCKREMAETVSELKLSELVDMKEKSRRNSAEKISPV